MSLERERQEEYIRSLNLDSVLPRRFHDFMAVQPTSTTLGDNFVAHRLQLVKAVRVDVLSPVKSNGINTLPRRSSFLCYSHCTSRAKSFPTLKYTGTPRQLPFRYSLQNPGEDMIGPTTPTAKRNERAENEPTLLGYPLFSSTLCWQVPTGWDMHT